MIIYIISNKVTASNEKYKKKTKTPVVEFFLWISY